jgi:hypothetical protein
MYPSYPFDPELHEPGTDAASGRCSYHLSDAGRGEADECAGEAVVSFQDSAASWQSGCARALERLVEGGEIEPLGQGA